MNLNALGSLLTEASELSTDGFDMEPLAISSHHHPHHHSTPHETPLPKPPATVSPTKPKAEPELEKPKRPLSAYNIFFRHERNRIISPDGDEDEAPLTIDSIKLDTTRRRKKRLHRKTHGKIGFADLARRIADKWKSLDDENRRVFETVAAREKKRYAEEIKEWKQAKELQQVQADARANDIDTEPLDIHHDPYAYVPTSSGGYYDQQSQQQQFGNDNSEDYLRMTEATLDMARASLSLPLFSTMNGGRQVRRSSHFEPTSLSQIASTPTQSASELSRQFREMLYPNNQTQRSSVRTFKSPEEEAFYRHYFV